MDKLLWIIVIFVFIILVFSIFDKFRVKYNINEGFMGVNNTYYPRSGNSMIEGFNTKINFCPFNSKEFIDKKGNSVCCDGKVEDNICYSKIMCTLSTTNEYPSCNKVYTDYIKNQERKMCPEGWKYYENNKEKGCVNGAVI
jgi:hypothetical protein